MELIKLNISDKDNSIQYVLKINDESVGYGYIFNRETNPIEIYIEKEHQSCGYGKYLFNSLLTILKNQGLKGIIFETNESNFRLINILLNANAVQISKRSPIVKFIIKL